MAANSISLDELEIRRLEAEPETGFDCGQEEQNTFLYTRAWADQCEGVSTTYLYYLHGILAGYATVVMDGLILSRRERPWRIRYETVGALKLAQLGVHRELSGRSLGSLIIADVIGLAVRISEAVGCRYVTVDARHDVVGWYEKLGFKHNRQMQEHRVERALKLGRDADRLAKSMRFDIRDVVG